MNYENKINSILTQDEDKPKSSIDGAEEDQVIKDPRVVDITNPEYIQIHLLRFEKGNKVRNSLSNVLEK